jgi:putative Holliday junction resolvase
MGRILALDFGLRRVGAAMSNPARTIATPLEVHERGSAEQDARHYRTLVQDHEIEGIVIGLPVHTSGREGEQASRARAWGGWLSAVTGLPVAFADERYTTVEADSLMIRSGLKRQKRKGVRDKLAAQILLQAYLDAGCPDQLAPPLPLADPEVHEP